MKESGRAFAAKEPELRRMIADVDEKSAKYHKALMDKSVVIGEQYLKAAKKYYRED